MKVIDVGGGNGNSLCSFFHYPETLEYYLVDPNLRLIHDFYYRIFFKLSVLKMAHVLAYAEQLPFKSEFADIVISLAAIDHYKDYKLFIQESHRVLKPGGMLFIFSHIDNKKRKQKNTTNKLFNLIGFLEKVTRYLHYRSNKVKNDDHTFHFKNTDEIINCLNKTGFTVSLHKIKENHFMIKSNK